MLELNAEVFRTQKENRPVVFYAAIRWTSGSASPLSASYGNVRTPD
jgi:hypothetical protein